MPSHVHITDPAAAGEAADLVARLGSHAASEAAMRADEARDRGNVINYCRWRQIGRLIDLLNRGPMAFTLH